MSWDWSNGKAILSTLSTSTDTLTLTEGYNITSPIEVPRIYPYSSCKTLGAYISPSGSSTQAILILKEKAIDYGARLTGSHLNREEAYRQPTLVVYQSSPGLQDWSIYYYHIAQMHGTQETQSDMEKPSRNKEQQRYLYRLKRFQQLMQSTQTTHLLFQVIFSLCSHLKPSSSDCHKI